MKVLTNGLNRAMRSREMDLTLDHTEHLICLSTLVAAIPNISVKGARHARPSTRF